MAMADREVCQLGSVYIDLQFSLNLGADNFVQYSWGGGGVGEEIARLHRLAFLWIFT